MDRQEAREKAQQLDELLNRESEQQRLERLARESALEMSLEQAAKKALKRPSDFFTSDDRIGTTHGFTISVHRDSDILGQSNWEVIKDDMLERFPDDVFVHSSTHWVHGWMDQLAVRVYLHYPLPVGRVPSPAFRAIMQWHDTLENYPIADESHYSEMEYNDAIETLENSYNVSKGFSHAAFSWLFDNYSYCSAEEYNDDAVAEAIAAIGDDCQECGFQTAAKTHTKQISYGTLKQALCVSCYIAATRRR
jgi:hypothetical protein